MNFEIEESEGMNWKKFTIHYRDQPPVEFDIRSRNFATDYYDALRSYIDDLPVDVKDAEFMALQRRLKVSKKSRLVTYVSTCGVSSKGMFYSTEDLLRYLSSQTRRDRSQNVFFVFHNSSAPPEIVLESPNRDNRHVQQCLEKSTEHYAFRFAINGNISLSDIYIHLWDSSRTAIKVRGRPVGPFQLSTFQNSDTLTTAYGKDVCVKIPYHRLFYSECEPENYLNPITKNVDGHWRYYFKLEYRGSCDVIYETKPMLIYFSSFKEGTVDPCFCPSR